MNNKIGQFGVATLLGWVAFVGGTRVICDSKNSNETVYNFNATNIYDNETISLSRYEDRVLVVINVATY